MDESKLIEKLRRIEALHAGATTLVASWDHREGRDYIRPLKNELDVRCGRIAHGGSSLTTGESDAPAHAHRVDGPGPLLDHAHSRSARLRQTIGLHDEVRPLREVRILGTTIEAITISVLSSTTQYAITVSPISANRKTCANSSTDLSPATNLPSAMRFLSGS